MRTLPSTFRRAFTFGILSLSAVALLMTGGCDGQKGGRAKVVNTEVEYMTVTPQDVEYSRMITGRTAPVMLAEVRPQVSGIIKEREQDVVNALTEANYTILEIRRKGEWVAMLSRRPD